MGCMTVTQVWWADTGVPTEQLVAISNRMLSIYDLVAGNDSQTGCSTGREGSHVSAAVSSSEVAAAPPLHARGSVEQVDQTVPKPPSGYIPSKRLRTEGAGEGAPSSGDGAVDGKRARVGDRTDGPPPSPSAAAVVPPGTLGPSPQRLQPGAEAQVAVNGGEQSRVLAQAPSLEEGEIEEGEIL